MFKIDRSSVEYIDSNKEIVVIKQWLRENVGELEPGENTEESNASTPIVQQVQPPGIDIEMQIKRAFREAQRIVEEANTQADGILKTAKQEGYSQGLSEAEAILRQLQRDNAEQLNNLLTKLEEVQKQVLSELEENVLQLSLAVSQKIINVELEKNDIVYRNLIKQAINKLNIKADFLIRLNAQEYQKYFSNGGEWLSKDINDVPFTAVMDNTVPPGGCVLETSDSIIKVGVDSQMKMITMALNQE